MPIKLSALQYITDIRCGRYMESGLYSLPGVPSFPLPVYAGTALASYIAGAGTPMPEIVPAESHHLIGYAPTCTGPTITLDGSSSYDSEVYTASVGALEDANTWASNYTGLLRLAVQAKVGAGRDVEELTPWGLDGSHGLLRTDTFDYFTIKASSSGVNARKMKTRLLCVKNWLTQYKAGSLSMTDADAIRFESYLLSTIEVDDTTSDVELINAAGVANVYGGRNPFAYAWHFSRNWENAAAIVTYQVGAGATAGSYYWESTLAELAFHFNVIVNEQITADHDVEVATANSIDSGLIVKSAPGGTVYTHLTDYTFTANGVTALSTGTIADTQTLYLDYTSTDAEIGATLTISEQDQQFCVAAIDKLWYPLGGTSYLLIKPSGNIDKDVGTNAPIYCFYTDSGLEVVRYTRPIEEAKDPAQNLGSTIVCGNTEVHEALRRKSAGWGGGGWSTSGGADATAEHIPTAYVQTQDCEFLNQHVLTGTSGNGWYAFNDYILQCGGTMFPLADFPATNVCNAKFSVGTGEKVTTTYYENVTNFERMVIINGDNAEAVTVLEGWSTSQGSKNEYSTVHDTATTGGMVYAIELQDKHGVWRGPYNLQVNYSDTSGGGLYLSVGGAPAAYHPVVNRPSVYTHTQPSGDSSTSFSGQTVLSTGSQSLAGSWSDWTTFRNGSQAKTTVSHTLSCGESWGGEAQMYEEPATQRLVAMALVPEADTKRWGGWV